MRGNSILYQRLVGTPSRRCLRAAIARRHDRVTHEPLDALRTTDLGLMSVGSGAMRAMAQSRPASVVGPANQTDTPGVILERYAAAWRGARELTFERSLTVALWVTGNGGGEYHVVLPQKDGDRSNRGAG